MATYSKLRDGTWGIKVEGEAHQGCAYSVTTKAGATKHETVQKVLWTGADTRTRKIVSLCTIVHFEGGTSEGHSHQSRRRSSSGGRCRDCGGPIQDAPEHRAMGGLCGTCAFDEYDM